MNKLTKEQAIILTAFTGVLCCTSFENFHKAVEEKLGRPVWTHQFGDEYLMKQIKEAFREDFLSILPDRPKGES